MQRLFVLLLSVTSLCFVQATNSQEHYKKTILVLDASGSMWGQIDGITKIKIAQSVINKLLIDFPIEQPLGLTVYGHNRKGDCSDIETLVHPAVNTKDAILNSGEYYQTDG